MMRHTWRAFLFCLNGHLGGLHNVFPGGWKVVNEKQGLRASGENKLSAVCSPLWRKRWNRDTSEMRWISLFTGVKERCHLLPFITTSLSLTLPLSVSLYLCCVFQADALHSEASEETMSHPLRWLKYLTSSESPAPHMASKHHPNSDAFP